MLKMMKSRTTKRMVSRVLLGAVLAGTVAMSMPQTARADTFWSDFEDFTRQAMRDQEASIDVSQGSGISKFKLKGDHADLDVHIDSLPNISIKLDKNAIKFDNIDLMKETVHEKYVGMTVESNMPYDMYVQGLDDFRSEQPGNKNTIPVSQLDTNVGNSGYKTIQLKKDTLLLSETTLGDKTFDVSFKFKKYMKARAGRYKTTVRYTVRQK